MAMVRHIIKTAGITAALLIFWSCADKIAGGGGVETGNPEISGRIQVDEGPAMGVVVTLYPENFNPVKDEVPESRRSIADADGNYLFKAAEKGTYNLQALHPENRTTALVRGVEVVNAEKDTVIAVPNTQLENPAAITIHLLETAIQHPGHVYIPGTGINVQITEEVLSDRQVTIQDVPAGRYAIISYVAAGKTEAVNLLTDTIEAGSGETIVQGPYAAWSHRVKVSINTTSSGADVGEEVLDFPLLVRLDTKPVMSRTAKLSADARRYRDIGYQATFFDTDTDSGLRCASPLQADPACPAKLERRRDTDFKGHSLSQSVFEVTQSDGHDIRFTKSNGVTPLAYEIERWDTDKGLAEIWVKVDTVYGNNDKQYIILYTGNDKAEAKSSGPAVFDTSKGFTAVWHLNEAPDSTRAGVLDRTGNGLDGITRPGVPQDALTSGVIGKAIDLGGQGEYIALPASSHFIPSENAPLTLSAWIRPDSIEGRLDSVEHRLLSFKLNAVDSSVLALGITKKGAPGHYSRKPDSAFDWSATLSLDNFYLITLTYDGNAFHGYVNGLLDSSFSGDGYPAGGPAHAVLGAHRPNDRNFIGLIDEVRISHAARPAAWVKLNYESQKPNSNVVEFGNSKF